MSETVRYTLLLDQQANSNVEELQRRYGLRSKAAVFDLAASFLLWASDQQAEGFRVGRTDGNNFAEVLLPRLTRPMPATAGVDAAGPAATSDRKGRRHLSAVNQSAPASS